MNPDRMFVEIDIFDVHISELGDPDAR